MKAIFLDRDGVINRKPPDGQYVAAWKEMQFCPGVFEAVLSLKQAGFKIIVATNQRGVALRKIQPEALADIHSRMKERFASQGVELTGIYVCPHDNYENCSCRKPQPGMLFQAAQDHSIDLSSSWMIGDASSDIAAGNAAGCKTVRIFPSLSSRETDVKADITAPNLPAAARQILQAIRSVQ